MTVIHDLTTGVQHREFGALEVREGVDGAREVEGIGVPYDTPIEFMGVREQFAKGAVDTAEDVKLFWRHRDPIGKVIASRNEDDGWYHRSVVSKTATGDEAYQLARDGVIDRFSVGFEPIEFTETKEDDGTLSITHTKVRLREVSLVPFPAYDDAQLTQVREHATETTHNPDREERTMENDTLTDEVGELRATVDELNRRVEVGLTPPEPASRHTARSFGEFVQKLAHGDEVVTRAYAGAVSGDFILEDQWVGNLVDVITKRQTIAATFARGPVPAKGLTVEYAVLDDDSTDVDVQSAEGDDLAFGKVSVTTESAPVKTLGGYTTMSRQAIERTENVSILDTTFRAMAEKYGQAVEAMARAAFDTHVDGSPDTVTGDLSTDQDGVLDALVDLAEHFDDKGLSFDGLFVAKDVFKALYQMAQTDKMLQLSGAPQDKAGTVSVNTITANLSNIGVRVLPNATTGQVVAYDSSAMRTLESAGAPIRLQDDNIINLSRDFSVYGYAASFVQRPAGLVVLEASV